MSSTDMRVRVVPAISEIAADDWNACLDSGLAAAPDSTPQDRAGACAVSASAAVNAESHSQHHPHNPFVSHEFLLALEQSKSVGARSGWQPQHLVLEDASGRVLGAAPCYLKSHSQGEYVFDWGWAEAYERAGGRYYPKLQVAVPFTPATGPRLLVHPQADPAAVRAALAAALVELTRMRGASSAHVTFLTEPEWQLLGQRGFLLRIHQQFHWDNAGYATFEDFLGALNSRKRKAIRRERRDAMESDISIHWLTGADLTEAVWDAFFAFYIDTGSRKWGRPYLTRRFFSLVGESMRERIVLMMARRGGRYVAGAINFIGAGTLYGRHWGAIEHHPFLHFEVCYYQAIEFAIAHGLARVEAGAQGEHKLARGYLPVTTHSAHYVADPGLRRAIADFLKHERAQVSAIGEELADAAPFRRGHSADRDPD